MLGGSGTGLPGSAGSASAGVYNPLTFKVEPVPEQNIRNILLSNQHTVVSYDANAFVDESDYTAQYGASGSRGVADNFKYVLYVWVICFPLCRAVRSPRIRLASPS